MTVAEVKAYLFYVLQNSGYTEPNAVADMIEELIDAKISEAVRKYMPDCGECGEIMQAGPEGKECGCYRPEFPETKVIENLELSQPIPRKTFDDTFGHPS